MCVCVCVFLGVDNESLQKDKSKCVYCSKFVTRVHVLIVRGQDK